MIGHVIHGNTQPLLNSLQRSKCYSNAILILCSVPSRSLVSRRRSYHHYINNIVTRGVPLVLRLLPTVLVRNKWSNSLIQQSPKNYVLTYGMVGRNYSTKRTHQSGRNRSTLIYTTATAIIVLGLSYAAVPLYRMFCQVCCICLPLGYSVRPLKVKCMFLVHSSFIDHQAFLF